MVFISCCTSLYIYITILTNCTSATKYASPHCYLIQPSMIRTTVKHIEWYLSNFFFSSTAVTTQNVYTYHCHNTKHVHVPLSQHKTCTRTTVTTQTCKHTSVTTQNMYTYLCHNTKHVHVPLSQHKHVNIPLSQHKTCTRTTVTTQNMYTYRCHNSKHVHVPL